jgi:hypothetical protein
MSRKQKVAWAMGSMVLAVRSVRLVVPLVAEAKSQQSARQEHR